MLLLNLWSQLKALKDVLTPQSPETPKLMPTPLQLEIKLLLVNPETVQYSCSNVNFEMRDGCPGVRYQDPDDNEAGWTPVVGRRRRKKRLPDFVLRRFLPDHCMQMAHRDCGNQSDDSSSGDEELTIPTGANVHFSVNEGKPGLQIRTQYTSSWTPIASRTRSKC